MCVRECPYVSVLLLCFLYRMHNRHHLLGVPVPSSYPLAYNVAMCTAVHISLLLTPLCHTAINELRLQLFIDSITV